MFTCIGEGVVVIFIGLSVQFISFIFSFSFPLHFSLSPSVATRDRKHPRNEGTRQQEAAKQWRMIE